MLSSTLPRDSSSAIYGKYRRFTNCSNCVGEPIKSRQDTTWRNLTPFYIVLT